MDRVLRNASVGALATIGQPNHAASSPSSPGDGGLFALFGTAVDDAHRSGVAEGRALEREQLGDHIAGLGAAIDDAVASLVTERRRLRDEQAASLMETAVEIARLMVGVTPPDEIAAALGDRIAGALRDIDDGPVTITLAPYDAELVGEGLAADGGAEIAVDRHLAPGEARIRGEWASIDMTRDVVLEAVREVLT